MNAPTINGRNGPQEGESCLAHQFAKHGALTREDVETLQELEKDPIHVPAGGRLREQGREFSDLILIREGWASTFYEDGDGARQVIYFHVSGEFAGLHDIPYDKAITTTVALTDVAVCRLPRRRLMELIDRSPRVAALLFMTQMQLEATLVERIVSLGCRSALKRTAHLLIELERRRSNAAISVGDHIPLSQRQLADCLGLTDVHVNRCVRKLKDIGAIAVGRNRLRVLDTEALERYARFDEAIFEPSPENMGAPREVSDGRA